MDSNSDRHSKEVDAFDKLSALAKEFIYEYGTPHSTIVINQLGIEHSDGRMANSFMSDEK